MAAELHLINRGHQYDRHSPWRWLASHLARYKPQVLCYVLGTLAWQILTSAIPWMTGRGFDAVIGHARIGQTFVLVVVELLLIVFVRGLCGVATTYSLEVIANGLERDTRDELYRALLGKSQTFFNRHLVGDLMARATSDASQVNVMFQPGMEFMFIAIYGTIVPLAFIGLIRPDLLLIPVIFVAIFALAVRYHTRRLGPVSDAMRVQFGGMNGHMAETINGIELVEAAGQKAEERRRFAGNARDYRDLFIRQARVQALYLPPLLLTMALTGAFAYGLWLVTRGQLSIGELVAYLGLIVMLQQPVEAIGASLGMIRLGLSGSARILEVLNDETSLPEHPDGYRGDIKGHVVFEDVTCRYDSAIALDHVSFEVMPGETIALVGPTASGKTTLTKLVNRTYDPDAGRILVDGVDLRDWDLGVLRAQIAVIEQDVVLFARSIAENIAFGLGTADRCAVEAVARAGQAHGFIMELERGYDTVVGERGATLSGGQRQRLAICRALLANPRILILDDSTSAVDSRTEEQIQKAIGRMAAGRTTFLITHRLTQIKRADRILVLERGRVVDQGTHDELLDRCGLYHRIFAAHI